MHIVIDGNIGSGKTTQLELLDAAGWLVKREPLDQWPLELFYKDMSRWALLLQLKILQTIRPVKEGVTVYERCLLSTRYVFWEYLWSKKLVRAEEHDVYENAYEKYKWYPDVYIYLAKKPELAHAHIQSRGQTGDKSVTLAYLKDLDGLYTRMLMHVPCHVHVLNAHQSPEEIHAEVLTILSKYTVRGPDGSWVPKSDDRRSKVSKRVPVPCTPFTNMCRLS
jgi:deoxyadenosine/deoxycytidine kinase